MTYAELQRIMGKEGYRMTKRAWETSSEYPHRLFLSSGDELERTEMGSRVAAYLAPLDHGIIPDSLRGRLVQA